MRCFEAACTDYQKYLNGPSARRFAMLSLAAATSSGAMKQFTGQEEEQTERMSSCD
jgi:hypothetical protein